MDKKRLIFAAVLMVLAIGFILWDTISHRQDIDAFSGATPQAFKLHPQGAISINN